MSATVRALSLVAPRTYKVLEFPGPGQSPVDCWSRTFSQAYVAQINIPSRVIPPSMPGQRTHRLRPFRSYKGTRMWARLWKSTAVAP